MKLLAPQHSSFREKTAKNSIMSIVLLPQGKPMYLLRKTISLMYLTLTERFCAKG